MSTEVLTQSAFANMGLHDLVISAVETLGYEEPTPIQTAAIPVFMAGRDILGQAQTGTGKTAAFALPILSMLDVNVRKPQALVLVPTRELAIQLTEAFQEYSSKMGSVSILSVYGGQSYTEQLRGLKRGVHIIIGTPGRVMDHMRRGTLALDNLKFMVLDEADEMLQMGFIEDITWVLEQTPEERQTALFSATMPISVRNIAQRHMKEPEHITLKLKTAAPQTINQRHIMLNHSAKVDALVRLIEAETYDGMLVFVRTKVATMELAEQLEAKGYAVEALNGDIKQAQREKTVERFKSGKVDILVATDVAARGLDVDRISHVVNFDIPHDIETYIHRVGRTGRAGRAGEAILFATHKEKRMLFAIEHATKQKIATMEPPSAKAINKKRTARFKDSLTATLESADLEFFKSMLSEYQGETNVTTLEIAAALATQLYGDRPFLFKDSVKEKYASQRRSDSANDKDSSGKGKGAKARGKSDAPMEQVVSMERFRIAVGKNHGAKPGNIVGAIANEAGIDSAYIRKLKMFDEYSTVELPTGMPPQIFETLKKARIGKRTLNIARFAEAKKSAGKKKAGAPKKKSAGK